MEYFDLYQLPISLVVNTEQVTRKYYELSKQFHPDRYTNKSQAEQQKALQLSAAINKAKKVLSSPLLRLEYILLQKGVLLPDEKAALPTDFLMMMMDINEELLEWQSEVNPLAKETLLKKLDEIHSKIYSPVSHLFSVEELSLDNDELNVLKTYFLQNKYIQRLYEQLKR
jgi:Fe-S protein assembly co-chaperone HscB